MVFLMKRRLQVTIMIMSDSLDNTDRGLFFSDFSIIDVEAALTFSKGFEKTEKPPHP